MNNYRIEFKFGSRSGSRWVKHHNGLKARIKLQNQLTREYGNQIPFEANILEVKSTEKLD